MGVGMLPALALTVFAAWLAEEVPEPARPTSRWGVAASTSFRFGAARGINNALGPRFGFFTPVDAERYFTPALALMLETEWGIEKGTGALGVEARLEVLLAPAEGLLVPWVVLWLSGGVGAAWLDRPATPLFHVGLGLGGNAFADAGAWGPHHSWADWMEGITWPLVLLATLAGLPLAMVHVEARLNFYPELTGLRAWPSLLVGFGM